MTRDAITSKELEMVLDYIPAAVMVRDVRDQKLLYANCLANELLQKEDIAASFLEPYPLCASEEGNFKDHTSRKYRHPVSQRVYKLSRKPIDWAGTKAQMEYITDITDIEAEEERHREAQMELDHLINSIPGGIASYRVEQESFIPVFFSDGVTSISGHSREEYDEMVKDNALDIIYELDRERVLTAVKASLMSGEVLDISYRMRHKNGSLIWIHLNGRRIGPLSEVSKFYAVFTGMSTETQLLQSITNETADEIYVIDKETYELLYTNGAGKIFSEGLGYLGKTCYSALYGKNAPCDFCTLCCGYTSGKEYEMEVKETGRIYNTRFREMEWNGIPAYIRFVRDVTEDILIRREKERLEMYFKSIVDKIPGGIAVLRMEPDGTLTPEFISEGFAAMTHMTVEEAAGLYHRDVFAGVHPDDIPGIQKKLVQSINQGSEQFEIIGRMLRGDGEYVWVKDNLLVKRMSDGILRLYCAYTDISREIEEKAQLRAKYEDLIMQHYHTPGPDTLVVAHSNITQDQIIEKRDYTQHHTFDTMGMDWDGFFISIAGHIVEEEDQGCFLNKYLKVQLLKAYRQNVTKQVMDCFIQLPYEIKGRYLRFKVNMVETPDTTDVTGILTVIDITEQTIADRILHQLSVTSHDYIIDLDMSKDYYKVLSFNNYAHCLPNRSGSYVKEMECRANTLVVPRDRESYRKALSPDGMRSRLGTEGSYTFTYSLADKSGEIHAKNIAVSSIDLRLGRCCLVCTDITDSVKKQQSLLNMIAYTFDVAGLIQVGSRRFTMYTRQTILENLPPYYEDDYHNALEKFVEFYDTREEAITRFSIENMVEMLSERPAGYDFVLAYKVGKQVRYKQINVLWGDQSHEIICVVRADVTDMLATERQSQKELENALMAAKKANQAKSEFLSAMSHDIRTPMNAIMGMTMLAKAHIDNRHRMEDYLQKISVSSKHLLSLINDALDMSRIERSQITLNPMHVSLSELLEGIDAIIGPQAKAAGLHFHNLTSKIVHNHFCGDPLRINQVLLNLLSNAVKFTPEGGTVSLVTEEMLPSDSTAAERIHYRFTIRDTGIGMTEEFLNRIFEPFARETSVLHIEGTGLGLSIIKGLIDLMEGSIVIQSQIGKGSQFQIELGFEKVQEGVELFERAKGGDLLEGRNFTNCHFLIVEDNDINTEILCELLSMQGASFLTRTDGAQAVKAFQDARPGTYDAILMDIQMPVMNGYEATQAIRQLNRPDAETIPIIAMTANAFAEDIQAALHAGMDAHVAKPIDTAVLFQELRRLLNA